MTESVRELMTRIDEIVAKLEQDGVSLEDSVAGFEEGILLIRKAQTSLDKAEQRVKVLMDEAVESQADNSD